ncbi:hypothetical protein V1477_001168 [Vespula maculifrons]|uniref:Uncharacterized protein n=1 Tax=Vespula maculifrons TaxID=7453 RepID=A0ABD2CZN0_VESMC
MPFGLGATSPSTESSRRPPRVVDAFAVSSVRCPRMPSQFGVLILQGTFCTKSFTCLREFKSFDGQAGVRWVHTKRIAAVYLLVRGELTSDFVTTVNLGKEGQAWTQLDT